MQPSPNPIRELRLMFAVLALLAAAGSGAEPLALPGMQGLGEVEHHRIQSEESGHAYHVLVRLPGTEGTGPLPVVYLLDAGITFPLLGAYYRYLSLSGELPPLMIVGISYGNHDWRQGNFRATDFTAPAADRDHYGGAARFGRFLEHELFPLIEDRYLADPARRVIFGQSLGGQFVVYAASFAPGLFWGHIASNPALHRNLDFFTGSAQPASREAPTRLFVGSASDDAERFRAPAPAAFRAGLRWLFEEH